MDVAVTPVAPASISGASSVRTAKCACCGKRRDLVAHSGMDATEPDICFRCGSDRAQGMECTSKPRQHVSTFAPGDWDAR